MSHLTRLEIERRLLAGETIAWISLSKAREKIALSDAKQRRLFAFLLGSRVRTPTGLPDEFIRGIQAAYDAANDPALDASLHQEASAGTSPWRLISIESEGFGGINVHGGPTFRHDFDGESLLLEGPNGSGKSSLVGAVLWALTGDRPRDQNPSRAHEARPVFAADEKSVGSWPPLASYPTTATALKSSPAVRVALTFRSDDGKTATIERKLQDGRIDIVSDLPMQIPPVLLETGLLMPARLSAMRFEDGRGRLTDAVQKLAGLDDLIAIGNLASSLCNKSREYKAFRQRELQIKLEEFTQALQNARRVLASVNVSVPEFAPENTDAAAGEMASLGRTLAETAAALSSVISSDLASGINIADASTQNRVAAAIEAAKGDLAAGLENAASWRTIGEIHSSLTDSTILALRGAVDTASRRLVEATSIHNQGLSDARFQLKALAARWYDQHQAGAIDTCPLCTSKLDSALAWELESLRSIGAAATRAFEDNVNNILTTLDSELPVSVRRFGPEVLKLEPRARLVAELQAAFVENSRYAPTLVRFSTLVDVALQRAPSAALQIEERRAHTDPLVERYNERLAVVGWLIRLAEWHRDNSAAWRDWWEQAREHGTEGRGPDDAEAKPTESFSGCLARISDALDKARPYREAAALMRTAWRAGREAATIRKESKKREEIAESLVPLKSLGALCDSIAHDTIEKLSTSIAAILKQIHLTESLQFQSARLHRREELVVRAGFVPDLRIDSTLVANTSWLKAMLWAFIFAVREEAVRQIGTDVFPLIVFDDPQLTFDSQHRHRWAQYVAGLQGRLPAVQLVLATHDENFLNMIKVDGITGREAMIATASAEQGHVEIFEGARLERAWEAVEKHKTAQAAQRYISDSRIYVEGVLKLILRGEAIPVQTSVLGDCRQKIDDLNSQDGGIAPWNRSEVRKLVTRLCKTTNAIRFMEMSHHTSIQNLGVAEAQTVRDHLGKLLDALHNCFRLIREYQLVHGVGRALRSRPVKTPLPEGYKAKVRSIPLHLLGRAAALSDGRVADGRVSLYEFATHQHKKVTLAQHMAYRVTARTLEPVARVGDLLLVHEDDGEPPRNSLVVAIDHARMLARRFVVAENHSDIAVLGAQSINPHQIAAPVVAQRATVVMHRIVGVLYGDLPHPAAATEDEICPCSGEAELSPYVSNALGLVQVSGSSAEPYALDRQYLIVGNRISAPEALRNFDGKPIIAGDTDGNRYFKRLRAETGTCIVLESLDAGGTHGPVLLAPPGSKENCLEIVWPVLGVLFEVPG